MKTSEIKIGGEYMTDIRGERDVRVKVTMSGLSGRSVVYTLRRCDNGALVKGHKRAAALRPVG